jgi:hypothetical protein
VTEMLSRVPEASGSGLIRSRSQVILTIVDRRGEALTSGVFVSETWELFLTKISVIISVFHDGLTSHGRNC